jgi:hypothetical protein
VQRKKADRKAERRGAGSAYDEIWCMFDIDEHPNVDNAFALANGQGITLAVSNPCVELWFLLHFKPQTAWLDRHDAQQFADEFVGRGKTLTEAALNDLVNHHDDAVSRAQALDQMHQGHGSQPGSNPSSGVWRLIDTITVD